MRAVSMNTVQRKSGVGIMDVIAGMPQPVISHSPVARLSYLSPFRQTRHRLACSEQVLALAIP